MGRAGVSTRRATDHAVQRVDHHRFLRFEVKAVNKSAAARDARSAADAGLGIDRGMPVDLVARDAMPRPCEFWIGHVRPPLMSVSR